jgi:hypothetical protein
MPSFRWSSGFPRSSVILPIVYNIFFKLGKLMEFCHLKIEKDEESNFCIICTIVVEGIFFRKNNQIK